MDNSVRVREVGPRDGLQLVQGFMPTEKKKEWISRQAASGFADIEVTSFVPPKLLPQFADAAEVTAHANTISGLVASVLVLNMKGAQRAIEGGAKKLCFVVSASEEHSRSNVRCSTERSLEIFAEVKDWQVQHAPKANLMAAIATSFGCSLQGEVSNKRVMEIIGQLAKKGASEITLADTVGFANPNQVKQLFKQAVQEVGTIPVAAHFHDTRGMGLANVLAALDADIRIFDAALAGLGGCPFAPGATGNISTEDTVYMLESMGLSTGIDIDALLRLRMDLASWLPGESLHGRLGRAGPAINYTPAQPRKKIA